MAAKMAAVYDNVEVISLWAVYRCCIHYEFPEKIWLETIIWTLVSYFNFLFHQNFAWVTQDSRWRMAAIFDFGLRSNSVIC